MTSAQQQFGLRLRRERESRGVSLDAIAESTKVSKALFIGLEHGDLSRWPSGVYCRAHVCGYATTIGASPADVLAEFNEVYPDRCGEAPLPASNTNTNASTNADSSGISFRLTFARHAEPTVETRAKRAAIAAAEALILLGVGAVASRATGAEFWGASALIAFLYYPVTIALLGETAGFRAMPAAVGAIRGLNSSRPEATASEPEFSDPPLPALSDSGGMRLQAAGPVSGAMVLDSDGAQDDRPAHEYLH